MAVFEPAPTYADPVIVNEKLKPGQPGYSRFNPIWLKWFLDIVAIINASGGGGGTIQHNMLAGLQGGGANEFYHLTAPEHATTQALIAVAAKLEALAAVTPISATITTAKLTTGGANGSMTFVNGLLTAQTAAT